MADPALSLWGPLKTQHMLGLMQAHTHTHTHTHTLRYERIQLFRCYIVRTRGVKTRLAAHLKVTGSPKAQAEGLHKGFIKAPFIK